MNIANQIQYNIKLKKNLIRVSIFSGFLLLSNVLLAINLYNKDSRVILIPTHINKSFELSDEKVSDEYLELITRDIVHQILNLNRENFDYVEASILKIVHPSSYGKIKQELNELANDIKERDLSTNFSMNEIRINKQNLKVEILGYLETKLGTRSIGKELKKYNFIYDYTGAVLKLKEFFEVKDEK